MFSTRLFSHMQHNSTVVAFVLARMTGNFANRIQAVIIGRRTGAVPCRSQRSPVRAIPRCSAWQFLHAWNCRLMDKAIPITRAS